MVLSKLTPLLHRWNCEEIYHPQLNNEFHFVNSICEELGISLKFNGLGSKKYLIMN
jgi:hypothetical protein